MDDGVVDGGSSLENPSHPHPLICPQIFPQCVARSRTGSGARRGAPLRAAAQKKCYATPLLRRLASSLAPSLSAWCLLMRPRPRRFAARWPGSGVVQQVPLPQLGVVRGRQLAWFGLGWGWGLGLGLGSG